MIIQNVFYKIPNAEVFYKMVEKSKEVAYQIDVDILDCNKSWARSKSDLSVDEVIKISETSWFVHMVFIHRKGQNTNFGPEEYIELGLRTTQDLSSHHTVDYFIFIKIDMKYLNMFIEKFNLKEV
jgi:hypothetical protein